MLGVKKGKGVPLKRAPPLRVHVPPAQVQQQLGAAMMSAGAANQWQNQVGELLLAALVERLRGAWL